MKYSVVIPTYNHCNDLLMPCVNSVLAYSRMQEVELIISANGCTDNTKDYLADLQKQFTCLGFEDHLKVVWHDAALGFSKAVNAGIRASTGERVVLLNNDVILLHQPRHTWLERLNAPFENNPRTGITCTLKLYSAHTGRDFGVFFCTMIDRKVIHKIGLLNENYGVGAGEDTEYCFEAEHAGFEVHAVANTRYEPSIGTNASDFPIWHKAEGTMHDAELVPDWAHHFKNNDDRLKNRFTPVRLAESTTQLAERYPELAGELQASVSHFQEILSGNTYNLDATLMHNKEVIDIGANTGMFSIAAAALGASKVFSYEPATAVYYDCLQNIKTVNLSHKIQVQKSAVMGTQMDHLELSLFEAHGHNSVYKPGDLKERVPVTSFEQVMQQTFSHNVIVKLDCEGAEFDIIMKTPDATFSRIKRIILEIHEGYHPEYAARDVLYVRLQSLGFKSIGSKNVGMYWWNTSGELMRYEPGPLWIETWSK